MNIKDKRLFQLFSTTFLISASTSGGYAIVGIMKDKFVNKMKWVSEEEMMDLLAISQSSPGPIAINLSLLVGYKICGIPGAFITMLGTILPPLIIMSIVALFYEAFKDIQIIRYIMHGMSAGVAALLVNVTVDLFINLKKMHSLLNYILMIIAFILIRFSDVPILLIAIVCAIAGIIKIYTIKEANK